MKSTINIFTIIVLAFILCAGAAVAGSFSANFNDNLVPAGTTTYGSAYVDSGILSLTDAANRQHGAFVISDLDPGMAVSSIHAEFMLMIGGGSSLPADGFSFNFGDAPDSMFPDSFDGEEGVGSGLRICFDSSNTGSTTEGPAIEAWYADTVIARTFLSSSAVSTGTWVPIVIDCKSDGLTVTQNGITRIDTTVMGWNPHSGWRVSMAARTGMRNDNHCVDDLRVTTEATVPEPSAVILGITGLLGIVGLRRRSD